MSAGDNGPYLERDWETELAGALHLMLEEYALDEVDKEHTKGTPDRVVRAMKEYFAGAKVKPEELLFTTFSADHYDEMVYVNDIEFVSWCAHHLLPIVGKAHFAYVPNQSVVGLSKIPRLINVYASRLQIQERLTMQIVDCFYEHVKPLGCGLVMEAYHHCMLCRGVKKEQAWTKTTALKGSFCQPEVKAEFLDGIKKGR